MKLHQYQQLPDGFLETSAADLHQLFPGPSLVHLPGVKAERLFVTVLQHGNEDTGLKALQQLLKTYTGRMLPRPLSIFIANVSAARFGLRRLDGQPDYNRVWPGTEEADCQEAEVMRAVFLEMQQHALFACVDLHNNTGTNPHYAAICRADVQSLQLANLFNHVAIHFSQPHGTLVQAFAAFCPAVVLECGMVGDPVGTQHAVNFIEACLHMDALPQHAPAARDLQLYHSVARVVLPADCSISFSSAAADLMFASDLDHLNFNELKAGSCFARLAEPGRAGLLVYDDAERDVTQRFFVVRGRELCLKRPVMPSMLTVDERVIRQDCLCYFMERMDY